MTFVSSDSQKKSTEVDVWCNEFLLPRRPAGPELAVSVAVRETIGHHWTMSEHDYRASLKLRPLVEGDEAELLRIHGTPEVVRWWDVPEEGFPLTVEPETTRLTIEIDGRVAGMIQFYEEPDPRYRHAAIDLFLDPSLHDLGLGTEVVKQIVDILIDEHDHHRITIDPAVANAVAIRAYEKAGFKPVGIMRRYERDVGGDGWHDSFLMELLAGDRPGHHH